MLRTGLLQNDHQAEQLAPDEAIASEEWTGFVVRGVRPTSPVHRAFISGVRRCVSNGARRPRALKKRKGHRSGAGPSIAEANLS